MVKQIKANDPLADKKTGQINCWDEECKRIPKLFEATGCQYRIFNPDLDFLLEKWPRSGAELRQAEAARKLEQAGLCGLNRLGFSRNPVSLPGSKFSLFDNPGPQGPS